MSTKRAIALLAFLVMAVIGTGCDRLGNWQDIIDDCHCPTGGGGGGGGGGAGGDPPPSPATTPDGRPCSEVPNSPNCPRQA
jgi:hypothetical protein